MSHCANNPTLSLIKRKAECKTKHRPRFTECIQCVVYQIPLSWGNVYIGQTGRCLNDRLREHYYNVNSAIQGNLGMRCRDCGCTPIFDRCKILARCKSSLTQETIEEADITRAGQNRVSCSYVGLNAKELTFPDKDKLARSIATWEGSVRMCVSVFF